MTTVQSRQENPLSGAAGAVPLRTAYAVSFGARLLGALLVLSVAFDQAYDRTQVFAPLVAGLVLLSATPARGKLRPWLPALGSGLLFFAGAVLSHLTPGMGMLALGAFAGLAAGVASYQRGESVGPSVSGFLLGSGLTAVLIAAVVFTVEG